MNETGLFLTLEEKVRIGHTAVVVVDVQNDFCASGGWYSKNNDLTMIQAMIPKLDAFLRGAHSHGALTVLVKTIYSPHVISGVMREKLFQRGLDLEYCLENTWGSDFYVIKPDPVDIVIVKERHSAFFRTELDTVLRQHQIRTVILAGVATNVCIDSTAREAFALDYYVILLSDCTGTFSPQLQDLTLLNIEKVFGTVSTSDKILEIWKSRT